MTKTEWNPLAAMPMDREYEVYHVVNEDDCGMSDFHAHHYYEIYLYLTGNVNICVEEKLYQPEPYTLFIYPPGVMHRWIPRGGQERYERAYAYISKEFIEDLSTPDLPLERMLNEAITRRNYSYPLGCQTGSSVIGWIDEILHSYRSDDPADLHMNRCRMYMLLITVSRLFSSAVEETAALPARIRDIIFYINENISGPITLDTLAARFFVSKYYLLHTFKEYAGVSIHQYILKKRISHAQTLLHNGMEPGAAALACGFNDYSGFYRVFTRLVGVSPQAFCKGEGHRFFRSPIQSIDRKSNFCIDQSDDCNCSG